MSRSATRQFAVFLLGSFIGTASCGSTAETSVNVAGPTAIRCQATLGPAPSSFGPSGGNGSVAVSVARECTWTATVNAPWIVLTSAREGQGDGTVAYQVVENGDPIARGAAISVGGQSVQVSQEPAPCRFTVTAGDTTAPANGADLSVEVRAHTACSWAAASTVDWATPTPTSGSGDAVVHLRVGANSGPPRSATMTVAGRAVTVTQEARVAGPPPAPPAPTPGPPAPTPPAPTPPTPGPTPPPAPPPCTLGLTSSGATFEAIGGQGVVHVVTGAECAWTAQSNAAWVSIAPPAAGLGNSEVRYTVAENFSTSTRIALITIGSETHRVTQKEAQEIHLRGRLSGLTGTCPALQFTVGTQVVKTDRNTEFKKMDCSEIRNGIDIDVRGFRQPDGSLLARRVELD